MNTSRFIKSKVRTVSNIRRYIGGDFSYISSVTPTSFQLSPSTILLLRIIVVIIQSVLTNDYVNLHRNLIINGKGKSHLYLVACYPRME